MNLDQLLRFVNWVAAKETSGRTMKIIEYTNNLPFISWDLFDIELRKVRIGERVAPDALSNSPLRIFKTPLQLPSSDGQAVLPTDFAAYVSFSDGHTNIDIITEQEFNLRLGSVFHRADINPYGYLDGGQIWTAPNDLTLIYSIYLRKPAVPYYDYVQNAATLAEIYMPVGSYLNTTSTQDIYNLYSSTNVLLNSGVYKSGLTPGGNPAYISHSVELEWEDMMYPKIAWRLLSMIGVNISEELVVKYAEGKVNA